MAYFKSGPVIKINKIQCVYSYDVCNDDRNNSCKAKEQFSFNRRWQKHNNTDVYKH